MSKLIDYNQDARKKLKNGVGRLVFEFAASVAGMFITTECVIVKKTEKKESSVIDTADVM